MITLNTSGIFNQYAGLLLYYPQILPDQPLQPAASYGAIEPEKLIVTLDEKTKFDEMLASQGINVLHLSLVMYD
jgi:hypothetical protein